MWVSVKIKPVVRKGSVCSSASALVRFTSCVLAACARSRNVHNSEVKQVLTGYVLISNSAGWFLVSRMFGFQRKELDERDLTILFIFNLWFNISALGITWGLNWFLYFILFYYFLLELLENHGKDQDSIIKTILSVKMWSHWKRRCFIFTFLR